MKCKVCGSPTFLLVEDTYQCFACSHIFRDLRMPDTHYTSGEYRQIHEAQQIEKRKRWVANVMNFADLPPIEKAFEVGSGDGILCEHLSNAGADVYCCELDPFIIKNYIDKYHVYNDKFENINIDGSFDLVIAMDVVEHLEDPHPFYRKASQLTKYLIVQIPTNRNMRTPKVKQDGHYHYFSEKSLSVIGGMYGFKVIKSIITNKDFSANGQEIIMVYEKV